MMACDVAVTYSCKVPSKGCRMIAKDVLTGPLMGEIGVDTVVAYYLSLLKTQVKVVDAIEHFCRQIDEREVEREAARTLIGQQARHVDVGGNDEMGHFHLREVLEKLATVPIADVDRGIHAMDLRC